MRSKGRSIEIEAYAKINLGLRVLGKRPDGYHEIDTVIQSIDLSDHLTLKLHKDTITMEMSPELGIPVEENLALRAACLLREQVGFQAGVHIHLFKGIPVEAGLGGGSSDAAAVLIALNELLKLGLSLRELQALALDLGSDVPFFLVGGRCRARGRGEIIQKLPEDPALEAIVLLVPSFSLPTHEVYATFDRLVPAAAAPASAYPNDLEWAALELCPQLWEYRKFLQREAVPFGMSGSGPAYYALIPEDKEESFVRLAQEELDCKIHVCRQTPFGHKITRI